jgi:hypothetical protein
MNPPAVDPIYVTGLEEVLWGIVLVAITLAIHGVGILVTLRTSHAFKHRLAQAPSLVGGLSVIILASWVIILVHLVEVLVWAAFFVWKNAVASPNANASLAYYLALMDYTTLGCNYNLRLNWRLLEGMIGIAGFLAFAWSTGVLLTLAQDFQEQQLKLLKTRRGKRRSSAPPNPPGANQP